MNLSDLAKTVAQYAPMLGLVVGNPGGAGIAQIISALFGVNLSDIPELIKKIQTEPDAGAKLAELEINQRTELQRIALEQERLRFNDIENARQREITLGDKITGYIAVVYTVGYFLTIILMLLINVFADINHEEKEFMKIVVMGMSAGQIMILSYYFGSSNKNK